MQCVHKAPLACWPPRNSLNSVRRMQAADGPNSSQFEWHQVWVKTTARVSCNSSGVEAEREYLWIGASCPRPRVGVSGNCRSRYDWLTFV
jgi:hypothetical protein